MQDLAQPLVVGEQFRGGVGADLDREVQALVGRQRAEHGSQIVGECLGGEALGVNLQLARLHPGQVEDVVDEVQQVGS